MCNVGLATGLIGDGGLATGLTSNIMLTELKGSTPLPCSYIFTISRESLLTLVYAERLNSFYYQNICFTCNMCAAKAPVLEELLIRISPRVFRKHLSNLFVPFFPLWY